MATRDITKTERRSGATGIAVAREHDFRGGAPQKVAEALGWFSIGLGLTEIVAPRALSKWIGVPRRTTVMRLMGLREVAAGVGILTTRQKADWLWARVGGDMIDLVALARASRSRHSKPERVGVAVAAVAGVTALDAVCARQLENRQTAHIAASTIVNRPPEECYRFWRDIEKLPTFIEHLKSVRVTGDHRSHWIVKGPAGNDISWDAEITEDVPNERIAWRSLDASDIRNSGSVQFEPARGGRNTIVRVRMHYQLPTRIGGRLLSKVLGRDPGLRMRKDLLRFKQMLEAGETATTEGQPAGRPSGTTVLDRMARI